MKTAAQWNHNHICLEQLKYFYPNRKHCGIHIVVRGSISKELLSLELRSLEQRSLELLLLELRVERATTQKSY